MDMKLCQCTVVIGILYVAVYTLANPFAFAHACSILPDRPAPMTGS